MAMTVMSIGVGVAILAPGVLPADELDRQWFRGRIDHALPSVAPPTSANNDAEDPLSAEDLERRLAALPLQGPPPGTTVELHRRLGELETLERLWAGDASAAVVSVRPDAEGRFRLRTPDTGPWRLVARAPGFLSMELVPPVVPDVVELGTLWLVPSLDVDLGSTLEGLRPPAGLAGVGSTERIWLAAGTADHPLLALQQSLHGWRPLAARRWWRSGAFSFEVPRSGQRALWAMTPAGAHRLEVHADGVVAREASPTAEQVRVDLVVLRQAAFRSAPSRGAAASPCHGLLDERPLGPLDVPGTTNIPGRDGAQLRVVCAEGVGHAVLPGPSGAETTRLEVSVVAPRLPSIRWRLEGSGQTLNRVALVTGIDPRRDGPAATDAGGERGLRPPRASVHATTLDPLAGWVEVRAPGIAGHRMAGADFVSTARADAVPRSNATEAVDEEGAQNVDAWLRRPSLIEGWVRGDFGRGVAGIDLVALVPSVREREAGARPVWARTDEQGRFRLRDVPPDQPLLIATISSAHPPLVEAVRSPSAGARRQDVRIDLARPLDLVGWVSDAMGEPVERAEVTLRPLPEVQRIAVVATDLTAGTDVRRVATTDATGRFVFEDAELARVSLDVSAPGLASTFVSGIEPAPTDAVARGGRLEIELGTFELVEERRIEVSVADRDGVPVPAALISWTSSLLPGSTPLRFASRSPYRENPRHPIWHNTSADARGEATLGGIEEGATVTLLVEAAGFVPHRVDELVVDWDGAQTEPVEIVLLPEARIAGRVERADGSPLEDAYVALHATDIATDLGSPSMRTRRDGRFSFDRLPAGDLRVTVNAVDEAAIDPLDVKLDVGQQLDGLVLRAPPSAPVHGRVVEDGAPLEGVSVLCCGDLTRTDDSGAFEIERARLGAHVLEVRLRGRDDHRRQIEVGQSVNWFEIDVTRDPDLDLPLRTLRGRLRGSRDVEQRILDRRLGVGLLLRNRATGRAEPVVLDGLFFEATGVPAGRYLLSAVAPGTELASVMVDLREADRTDLVVDLEVESDQTLRITVEGVDARSSEGWFRFGLPLLLREENGLVVSRVARWHTEDDYLLERVSPGRWILEAESADGRRRARAEVELADGSGSHVLLVFEASERERFTGILRVDGTPASGWIMVRSRADGSPGAGSGTGGLGAAGSGADGSGVQPGAGTSSPALGTMVSTPSASVRANSLGQFEFAAPPGPARLLVSTGAAALGWFEVDLQPGIPIFLDFALQRVVGRVHSAGGVPVGGITVIARDAGGGAYRGRATSDPSGVFAIEMLVEQGVARSLEVAPEGTRDAAAWVPVIGGEVVVPIAPTGTGSNDLPP